MPRGDRTGPDGRGPMTGRGAGYCAGFPAPGFRNTGGYGYGAGRGFGRGFGRGCAGRMQGFRTMAYPYEYAPEEMVEADEKTALISQAEYLEDALHKVKQRLEELDSEKK